MIYVSQGHEKGIGLEIFLKSILTLTPKEQAFFTLVVNQKTFEENLSFLGLKREQFFNVKIVFLEENLISQSTDSLNYILKTISEKDILVTLPTSKDQLIINNEKLSGYTEFFRTYFNNKNISMIFKSFNDNVLLLSDHVNLQNVSNVITDDVISEKITLTVNGFEKYFNSIEEIYIAGLNPHAGENGLLGQEEIVLNKNLNKLSSKIGLNQLQFLSGDTLHIYKNKNINQLFVYAYHDQGLTRFKSENGFIGLNITFGLPFLRLSVDHGTAFNLYGKNCSNISGMIYLFKTALEVHKNVNK